ncbi:hypothetical protein [Enterobacter roggenkampii]|uniref:hypothetical protein n=1 Tax=Enterobacter roggenkampii TaxID=1812935 RepID=UPI0032AF4A53
MIVKRYSVGYKDSASGRYAAMLDKPDGGYVSHEDYAALEARCSALAAENAGLKSEVPMGAIENGRAFADRLEAYPFECQGGNLNMCSDWQELRRCFEHLSEWAMHGQSETPATDAFLAEVRAQGVEMFAASLKVVGGHEHPYSAVASEFAAQLRKGVQS